MRYVWIQILLIGLYGSVATAQPADTFVMTAQSSYTQPFTVHEVSASGGVLSSIAVLPAGFAPFSFVPARDNRSYLTVGSIGSTGLGVILGFDATGKISTLHAAPALLYPMDMVLDSAGDWLLLVRRSGLTGSEILRLRGNSITTVSTLPQHVAHGIAIDESTGLLLLAAVQGRNYGYFHLDPKTGAVTTFALYSGGVSIMYGARRPQYDAATGDFIDTMEFSSPSSGTKIVRAVRSKGIQVVSSSALAGLPVEMSDAGHRLRATAYHVLIERYTRPPLAHDIVGVRHDGAWLSSARVTGITPSRATPFLRVGSRHMAWSVVSPPNDRMLGISFPGEAGRPYVVGLSITGTLPGVALPDGRTIPVVPDPITYLCLQGGLPGVIDGTVGRLDANGAAVVRVKANRFGSAVKGLAAWATVLVLDPKSPSGVAAIAGPSRLELD